MPFITFTYKIKGDSNRYYGKYDFYNMSDDHEGLDLEVISLLIHGINKHRKKMDLPTISNDDVVVGILSYSDNQIIPTYSTQAEIKCFDFYCIEYDTEHKINYYIDGELV
jgi:hypothetical protein